MDLGAVLDAFDVDEAIVEVVERAAGGAVLHRTKRYLGLSRPEGGPIAVFVHRTRLVVTRPRHVVIKRDDLLSPAARTEAVATVRSALGPG